MKILFRPSEVFGIMTNSRTKAKEGEFTPSDTCRKLMQSKMIEIRYGRFKDIPSNKYITKGNDCEEQGITLYSVLKAKIFENNKLRAKNDYFSGEIDLAWNDDSGAIEAITDIKNSYNIHTFFDNTDNIKKANYWQGVAYLHLHPTAKKYHIANVLVNNTADAILLELHRESYKWQDGDTPSWRELEMVKDHIYTKEAFDEFISLRGCAPICDKSKEIHESFVEIPADQRLIEHTFERDNDEIEKLTNRIDECRKWMAENYGLIHEND